MDWFVLALALAAILAVQVLGFRLGHRVPFRLRGRDALLIVLGWGAVLLGFMVRAQVVRAGNLRRASQPTSVPMMGPQSSTTTNSRVRGTEPYELRAMKIRTFTQE